MENPKLILYIVLFVGYIIYQIYKSIKKSSDTTPPKDITTGPDFDIDEMLKEMKKMTKGQNERAEEKPQNKPTYKPPYNPPAHAKPAVKPKPPVKAKAPSAPMPEQTHYKYSKEGNRPERMVREAPVLFSKDTKARSQERTDQKDRIKMEKTRVDVVDYDEMLIEKGRIKKKSGEISDIHFSFSSPAELFHSKLDLREAVIMSEILRRPDY